MRDEWERWELPVYGLVLTWFAARVTFMALELHPFVPPDETTHIGRMVAYAKVWGVPDNGPATFEYGLLDRRPWLYYWLLARSLALNVFPLPDLIFARLVNGLLGVATAAVGVLWMRDWCRSGWAPVLFAVLVTNTLMFTGLSASVSYDNGANLLAAGSVFALTRFRTTRSVDWLLAFAALVFAGCLAKRTFLPLAFLLAVLLVLRERSQLRGAVAQAQQALRAVRPRTYVLLATTLVLAAFTLSLYGGNLAHYGKLRPGFDQVVGEENAMLNRIHARDRIVGGFRDGKITLREAQASASLIRHRGDRTDTLFLLKTSQLPESSLVGRVPYIGEWVWRMLRTSVGYLGHRRAVKPDSTLAIYFGIFALGGVLAAWRWRPGASQGVPVDAAFLVIGFAFVLMWLVNYPTYEKSRYIEMALQGRYAFPVLVPFYGLVAWSLGELPPPRLRPWLVAGAALFFLYGDLPWLLPQLGPAWRMPG
jgi:hypothetical protein